MMISPTCFLDLDLVIQVGGQTEKNQMMEVDNALMLDILFTLVATEKYQIVMNQTDGNDCR